MTLQPCPNEECTCRENPVNTARMRRSKDSSTWQVDCSWCEMRGPNCPTEARAESTWNALPRTEPWVSVAERMPDDGSRVDLICATHPDNEAEVDYTVTTDPDLMHEHGFVPLDSVAPCYTHWRTYTPPRGPVSR